VPPLLALVAGPPMLGCATLDPAGTVVEVPPLVLLVPVDVLVPVVPEPDVELADCDSEPVAVVEPVGLVAGVGVEEVEPLVVLGSAGSVSNPPAAAAAADAAPFSIARRRRVSTAAARTLWRVAVGCEVAAADEARGVASATDVGVTALCVGTLAAGADSEPGAVMPGRLLLAASLAPVPELLDAA
jgi:hypothetical protein